MSTLDAFMLVLVFIVFGVPALGITARLVLRPMVDSIVRLRESFTAGLAPDREDRIARLERDVQLLRSAVHQLSEGAAFDRKLRSGSRVATSVPNSMRIEEPPQA